MMGAPETTRATPLSKRQLVARLGVAALVAGIVLLIVGYFWKHNLLGLGLLGTVLGGFWLALAPFTSPEPVSRAWKRHQLELLLILAGYVLALFVFDLVRDSAAATWARALAAVLPTVPAIFMLRSLWRYVRRSDELERRIQMEAIIMAASVIAVLSFFGGFLQIAQVLPLENALIWVFPLLTVAYGVAVAWCRRKYGIDDWC